MRKQAHKSILRPLTSALLVLLVAATLPLVGAQDLALSGDNAGPYEESDEPTRAFARVRSADGGLKVQREQGFAEQLRANDSIFIGDQPETAETQRAEIQLPDGTLLRLDHSSSVELYDLAFAASPDDRTIVALRWGRIQADIADPRDGDAFRIDSPAASIYPLKRSSLRVDIEPDETTRITVERGRVEVAGQGGSVILRAGERTRVRAGQSPQRPYDVILRLRDGFGMWIDSRVESYALDRAPGAEYEALPEEVRPYYAELSRNGQWVQDDDYGWVWNPSVDDDWRPYERGEWDEGPSGPVWYGYEPWSWSVYRYGRWDFRFGIGWVWIPGRIFRPSHVRWYYGPDYVGWCPLGYYDYPVHISIGWGWGHSYFDNHPWTFIGYDNFYYHGVGSYRYHRNHASRVRPSLRRGVVSHRAVARSTREAREGAHAARARRGSLDRRTYDRARRMAGQGGQTVRSVEDAAARRAVQPRARRSFTDIERTAINQRAISRRSAEGRSGHRASGDAKPVIRVRPGAQSGARDHRDRSGVDAGRDASRRGTVRRQGKTPSPVAPRRGVTRRTPTRHREPASSARQGQDEGVRRLLGRVGGQDSDAIRRSRRDGSSAPAVGRSRAVTTPRSATPQSPARGSTRRPAKTRQPSRATPERRTPQKAPQTRTRPPQPRPRRETREKQNSSSSSSNGRPRSDASSSTRSRSRSESSSSTRSRSRSESSSSTRSRSRSSSSSKGSRSRSSGGSFRSSRGSSHSGSSRSSRRR